MQSIFFQVYVFVIQLTTVGYLLYLVISFQYFTLMIFLGEELSENAECEWISKQAFVRSFDFFSSTTIAVK